jgi:transposase
MELHANAALSLKGRRQLALRIVDQGWSLAEAAAAAEVSERTAAKWARRYRADGEAGLLDRSSAPRHVANRTPGWLWHYNHERPHRALSRQTPAARLTELNRNNVLGSYS